MWKKFQIFLRLCFNTELLLLREKSTSCSKGRMTWLKAFAANRIYTFESSSEWKLLEWLRKKSYGLFYVPMAERASISSLFHSSLRSLTCTPHRIIHQLCEESKGRGDYFFSLFPSIHFTRSVWCIEVRLEEVDRRKLNSRSRTTLTSNRAVGRSENPVVPLSFGGHNLPPPQDWEFFNWSEKI